MVISLVLCMHKAVFLDRDGTINEEMGYINHINRFKIFSFVPEAINLLNKADYQTVLVTNQSGVARGYYDESLVHDVHDKLREKLKEKSAHLDGIYYCPHHPTEGIGVYNKNCECRKPKTGMIDSAIKELNIDISKSFMVGDRYKDIEFAQKAGLHAIFVKTGYGLGEFTYQRKSWTIQPDYIAKDLLEAARYIKENPIQ